MKVQDQQRPPRLHELTGTGSRPSTSARSRRSRGSTTAAIAGVALLIGAVALFAVIGGSPTLRTTRPVAASQISHADDRVSNVVGWVQGLADGLILPTDVTERLSGQDPKTAKIVSSVWSALSPYRGSPRLPAALTWIEGLADGLISPGDVTGRLRMQHPALEKIVMTAWSGLPSTGWSESLE